MVRNTRGRVIDNWTVANRKQLTLTRTIGAVIKQLLDRFKSECRSGNVMKTKLITNTDVRHIK